ncbi:MAG: RusA family crossover junction endodeoxyribonuclease [Planctomycetaceae bacterium]|nr:RusA family crossover junction endodeoxyribonuclease [Planctomycetaceae bacterium]
MIINFSVPFPISVNQVYYAPFRKITMTPKAKEYKNWLAKELKTLVKTGEIPPMGKARISAHYIVVAGDRKARDLANLDKLLTDTIVDAGIMGDDSQIDDHRFTRAEIDPGNPRIDVFFKIIEGGELWRLN